MPTYDPSEMSEALQAAGERAAASSTISESQKSLTDIIEEDRSRHPLAALDVLSSSSHEDLQICSRQVLPIRSAPNQTSYFGLIFGA